MSILTYRFNEVPIKTPTGIFFLIDHIRFIWKCKGPGIAKPVLKKNVGKLTLPYIKAYYKVIMINVVGARLNWSVEQNSLKVDLYI